MCDCSFLASLLIVPMRFVSTDATDADGRSAAQRNILTNVWTEVRPNGTLQLQYTTRTAGGQTQMHMCVQ